MDLLSQLQKLAKKQCATVGIGVGSEKKATSVIKKSIKQATNDGYAQVCTYDTPDDLILALKSNKIDCAVRGTLPSKSTLDALRKVFKVVSLYRAAIICLDKKSCFFLAPVGIDEGIFIDERFEFIKRIDPFINRLGLKSKIAIISGGRLDDYGRSGIVDESLQAGEKLFKLAKNAGFNVIHYGILIEEAYTDSNIIIAPNGMVGNLLFRTLHFLGNTRSLGAPILNMDKIFIDTSRSKLDYSDPIMLASALSHQ
jgi:putative methanogen marker protein 4